MKVAKDKVETSDGGACWANDKNRDYNLLIDGFYGLYCPVTKCVVWDGIARSSIILGYADSLEKAKEIFFDKTTLFRTKTEILGEK